MLAYILYCRFIFIKAGRSNIHERTCYIAGIYLSEPALRIFMNEELTQRRFFMDFQTRKSRAQKNNRLLDP